MRRRDEMPVLHPGWDPGRRLRDRPRLRWAWLLLVTCAVVVAMLPFAWRAPREAPANEPAFPPEAFTTAPAVPQVSPTPATGVPAWDAGGPQVHPRTLPSPIRPASVAGEADSGRECTIDDLSIVNHGWDAWTGNTATVLTATNVVDEPCLLGGWPDLRLEQGGRVLGLTAERVSTSSGGRPVPPGRLLLRPGQSASTLLTWRGYRNAADQSTPQRLTARLGAGERREVPLEPPARIGPAPVDLVDGGSILIGAWQPARPMGG